MGCCWGGAAKPLDNDLSRQFFQEIDDVIDVLVKLGEPDPPRCDLIGQNGVPHRI